MASYFQCRQPLISSSDYAEYRDRRTWSWKFTIPQGGSCGYYWCSYIFYAQKAQCALYPSADCKKIPGVRRCDVYQSSDGEIMTLFNFRPTASCASSRRRKYPVCGTKRLSVSTHHASPIKEGVGETSFFTLPRNIRKIEGICFLWTPSPENISIPIALSS